MSENKKLSRSSDKNLKHFILNKHLKILSTIVDSKYQRNKISIDSNISQEKTNTKANYLLDKNIKIKKNFSVDKKIKPKSNKSLSKYVLKEKIVINCLDENQIKSVQPKEPCKSSTKLKIFQIEESLPILNFDRKVNYFNKQYKRTEQHSHTLKINRQSELVNRINKYIKEIKTPSKLLTIKKDSKPTILSPNNNINNVPQKKLEFSSLAINNEEKPINNIDLNNSFEEDDKNDDNCEENDSNSGSNEKEDKKIVVKTKFIIPFNENDEDKEDLKKEENINGKKKKLKLRDDIKSSRKMTFQPKDDKLLNKNIILSSVITKPGLNDDIEKTNQDSYLIKENIFAENFNIYGVFDGHGEDGHFISKYISNYISDYYTNELNFIENNPSLNKSNIFIDRNHQIIRQSIKELDTKLTTTKINFDIMQSGSTSVLLFLINETLICSNIGDSQCYLFSCSNEDLWTFESLAKIHKPSDSEEKKRIIENGGDVHPYYDENGVYEGPDRVYIKNKAYPGLSLSRSIGDLDGKNIGVISDPDIIVKKINENSKFIVLGSDGLWDVIKPYDVSRIVRIYFKKGDADGACKILLNKAIQKWKKNNEERDDITIIVIFLNNPKILLGEENNNLLNKINENDKEENKNNTSNQKPFVLSLD